ncbi:MAG: hypothetical protein GY793_03355 [Proteobacteria bacterium]|nr:hypothetical protein [Pseudomonadota bacterium]
MNKKLIKVKNEIVIADHIKKAEAKLPDIAKYQIAASGSPVFTVETEKDVRLIQESIGKLQHILDSSSATVIEITAIIHPIFKILASQNGQHVDLKVEMGEWVKLLEGEPLWAINTAVEKVCRTEKFRHFCDLNLAIKKQTKPIIRKIEKLKEIVKESTQKIEEEKFIEETAISVKQMQKNIANAAKNGNGFAKNYLKTNGVKQNG